MTTPESRHGSPRARAYVPQAPRGVAGHNRIRQFLHDQNSSEPTRGRPWNPVHRKKGRGRDDRGRFHMTPEIVHDHRALVLFSGGQDSTVCLAWALKNFDHVETVGFDYGQRHRVELEARTRVLEAIHGDFPEWSSRHASDQVLDLNVLKSVSDTAL